MKFLGELYKEKVLCLPKRKLRTVHLPSHCGEPDELRIQKELFTWKLYYRRYGRKTPFFIECRSEEEARFLKIFVDAGLSETCLPKENAYLKVILPEFEDLKRRTDEVIEEHLEFILDNQAREQIKRRVFAEITAQEEARAEA